MIKPNNAVPRPNPVPASVPIETMMRAIPKSIIAIPKSTVLIRSPPFLITQLFVPINKIPFFDIKNNASLCCVCVLNQCYTCTNNLIVVACSGVSRFNITSWSISASLYTYDPPSRFVSYIRLIKLYILNNSPHQHSSHCIFQFFDSRGV